MKKTAYNNSRMKYVLLEKRRRGIKEVLWSLKLDQRKYIEDILGFKTEEYLYEVRTKTFYNIHNLDPLLKNIHYWNKQDKRTRVVHLNDEQKNLLNDFNVHFRPCKYKIYLYQTPTGRF